MTAWGNIVAVIGIPKSKMTLAANDKIQHNINDGIDIVWNLYRFRSILLYIVLKFLFRIFLRSYN